MQRSNIREGFSRSQFHVSGEYCPNKFYGIHFSMVVSRPASAVSATEIASRLAGSVVLAFSLIW